MSHFNNDDFGKSNVNIKEAAQFLGFKSTSRLSQKARRGEIPGAFKAGVQWMFPKQELVNYATELHNMQREAMQVDIRRNNICHLAKIRKAHIGKRVSQSTELEYKNLRDALLKRTRNDMKISASKK